MFWAVVIAMAVRAWTVALAMCGSNTNQMHFQREEEYYYTM